MGCLGCFEVASGVARGDGGDDALLLPDERLRKGAVELDALELRARHVCDDALREGAHEELHAEDGEDHLQREEHADDVADRRQRFDERQAGAPQD